jgi:hypothetical protein
MKRPIGLALALPLFATLAACGDQVGAWGDPNSIVAAVDPALWTEVEGSVVEALEPTVRTVADEKAFTVTHTVPGDDIWGNMRKFRQLLVIGPPSDPYVAEVLGEVDDAGEVTPPQILQANNVWARNQVVTILVTPEADAAGGVRARLPELSALYDDQYRRWARQKMFVSGADSALADTLMTEHGFSLLLPQVYYWDRRDSVFVFRNDNPDPSELIRQIAVTWRTPIPPAAEFQAEQMLEARGAIAAEHYSEPQLVDTSGMQGGPGRLGNLQSYEIQATWTNAPDAGWPAGGPFILRSILCPEQNRLYLIDAWLYAPGKEKYEYMIQLQTILNTFRCGDAA